jgi:ferredoxin
MKADYAKRTCLIKILMSPERPAFPVVVLTPDGDRRIEVQSEEHIWDAAFKAGIVLPALCHQGRCLTCAGRLVDGGQVDQSDSASYFREDREAGFVLLCTAKARSALTVRTHQQSAMREHRRKKHLPAPYS